MNTPNNIVPIKALSAHELEQVLSELNQAKYRVDQITKWLYRDGVSSYEEMTNLPKKLREKLEEMYPLYTPQILDKQISQDGTRKYLLRYHDGALAEAVGIPSADGRLTVCFSTQVGCAMGCTFCATAKEGFTRNLGHGEMLDQFTLVQKDFNQRITNAVAMGQGEPFLNYSALVETLKFLNAKDGFGIGARKITISSCGIVKGIKKFANLPEQYTLAISLHSAEQAVRDLLMPQTARQPLTQLKTALQYYLEKTNRRITFEYTLIKGVNDTPKALEALIDYCNDLLCHVNLIPLNTVPSSLYQAGSHAQLQAWERSLKAAGIESSIRFSKGSDIMGACGQLKNSRKQG